MPRYQISVGEPWDFEGPDGANRVVVEGIGVAPGPNAPNWQPTYLLLRVEQPFMYRGESVQFLVASPRNEGVTLESLGRYGGNAGIARVRPNIHIAAGVPFGKDDVEYFMIGTLSPIT